MNRKNMWLFLNSLLLFLPVLEAFLRVQNIHRGWFQQNRGNQRLKMISYSSDEGVLSSLVEERDACGVGFVASLNNIKSHSVLSQALEACSCMEHRGATSVDKVSGDGAGVLTGIPWKLFSHLVDPESVRNADGTIATAVAMMFLSPNDGKEIEEKIFTILNRNGLTLIGWRDVPTDTSVLGPLSATYAPRVKQFVVQSLPEVQSPNRLAFEKRLYDTRRELHGYFRKMKMDDCYVCSLSSQTIVYKGMLRSCDLHRYYLDLVDPLYETNFAIYHRRFSTNTVPKWYLAQPMRLLAHNGEINTLLGNINWVKSRQQAYKIAHPALFYKDEDEEFVKGPLVDVGRSDSANLDSTLESFVRAGYSPEEALMILVPEAYEAKGDANHPDVAAFYQYYESLQEAWDGPALLVFSDGEVVGASLDRNGLRPARYMLIENIESQEKLVHLMSEVGVNKALPLFQNESDPTIETKPFRLLDSGRLGPGEMVVVNLPQQKLLVNEEVKLMVAQRQPYQQLIEHTIQRMNTQSFQKEPELFFNNYHPTALDNLISTLTLPKMNTLPLTESMDLQKMIGLQTVFGWGSEDIDLQIASMAAGAVEATFCMGDDCPLSVLSPLPHTLYDYFKQRFAQVTNPPIDSLREGAVMSLTMFLGRKFDPLMKETQKGTRVKIPSPVLNVAELKSLDQIPGIKLQTISTLYPLANAQAPGGLQRQLESLCAEAVAAVRSGVNIINLSDQETMNEDFWTITKKSGGKEKIFIPPLLAVGAVHHALIRQGLRTKASIIVTTGQAWSTHHFACLVGYGASAVVPYLAYDTVMYWHSQKRTQLAMNRGDIPLLTVDKALQNYRKAIEKGLLKILSKMGISLLTSYHGAQIFEALGLSDEVIKFAFKGTASRIGGMTFDDLAKESIDFYTRANPLFVSTATEAIAQDLAREEDRSHSQDNGEIKPQNPITKLSNYGLYNFLKSGEYHHNNQPLIKDILHAAIRNQDTNIYALYEATIRSRPPTTLRDCLELVIDQRPVVPMEEVESVESIMKRFVTGGMSLGALSREAHETLAIGMNRIGALSNSGEGGEDPIRFNPINDVDETTGESKRFPYLKGLRNGDMASSRIKQVASGRFGVTAEYLMSADQLEIKIAQGAKPGEGGQLPAGKIDVYIATLRKSKPGITLISPPPHHDIYSIEDLAQLIHDLHQINPKAKVSVKLVSEEGIGTVASGVAKAGADIIHISGHDGGTGASPASSIKHAGTPWELGLVESHLALRKNGLRNRVLLRADGGLKSGYDVIMAAAMGAEEYGFGTIALIAQGCIMARICHTNKCPVGITTQNEELRKRFTGTPEQIVTFFQYIAEEVRQLLSVLGFRSLEELIGHSEVLRPRSTLYSSSTGVKKTSSIDVNYILDSIRTAVKGSKIIENDENSRDWLEHPEVDHNGVTFDDRMLNKPEVQQAISDGLPLTIQSHVINTDRSAFGRIAGVLASRYGDRGFPGLLQFDLTGAGGQSFGVWLCQGLSIALTGYANDYVGKGMSGGRIVIKPPEADLLTIKQQANQKHQLSLATSVVGNTVLYGATGGELFIRGKGGERFAVRNSGATAVVESLGYHGCEYMTGGIVLILGKIGYNFGAGMTGGLSFIFPHEELLDADFLESNNRFPTLSTELSSDLLKPLVSSEVNILPLTNSHQNAKNFIAELLKKHHELTQSHRAKFLLDNMDTYFPHFVAIVPQSENNNELVAITTSNEEVITTEQYINVASNTTALSAKG